MKDYVRLAVRCITGATLLGALATAGASTVTQTAHPPEQHEWDYGKEHGPLHWGEIKPEFAPCRAGQRQSPVDVAKTEKADLPAIEFDYRPSPLRIIDNGHTILVTYASGSSIRVADTRYDLKQFHFHRPSESTIRGRSADMELHLVHADATGHLAVVGVMLDHGQENALVHELWKDIPHDKEREALIDGVSINAADLLPANRGYYTFEGSLTTPPCTEDVTWFLLKQPVQISADEVAAFAKLYPKDARPTQPLHGRVIRETR